MQIVEKDDPEHEKAVLKNVLENILAHEPKHHKPSKAATLDLPREELHSAKLAQATAPLAARSGNGAGAAQEEQTERTVFVRGLSLDITQEQLMSKLAIYGLVKSCRWNIGVRFVAQPFLL